MGERHGDRRSDGRPELDAGRVDPGAEGGAVRKAGLDRSWHQRPVGHRYPQQPAGGNQADGDRDREAGADRSGHVRGGRREDAHAEHGDRAEQPGDRVRDAEVALDRRNQRPGADDLRAQCQRDQEERRDKAGVLPQSIVS